jgi:hypothetical protein
MTAECPFCDLWKVSIDNGPAPSPEDGPPFSAHALRNKALLKYEIIGVVGAYVVAVLILGTLLLTIGRRLRRRAQEMASRPQEMVKPMTKNFDPSPISPRSARSWLRKKKSATSSIRSGHSNVGSPGMDSVVSFDNQIVEQDRLRRQEEMERLYAAVMAHDDRKSQGEPVGRIMTAEDHIGAAPPEYSQKRPPRLVTDDPRLRHLQAPDLGPRSPGTPKSPVRAIYPPDAAMPPMPQSPGGPIRAEYQSTTPLSPQFPSGEMRLNRKSRADSMGNRSFTSDSGSSGGKKLRKTLRNIKISAPLYVDDNSDGARTPLSPRFYTDPGIPPEPPTAKTTESTDSYLAPTTPGTAISPPFPYDSELREEEELDEVRDLPQAHPNRLSTYNYANEAQAVTNAASTRPDPTATRQTNASNVARPLPFRQLNTQPQQPTQAAYQQAYPLSPLNLHPNYTGIPFSAGPGQTQFVSPRRDKFGGPRTGMATPYSPYMPFTPLTPVTPHLTSRAERKQRVREERTIKGVITEEDQVADEKDLWSSGY